jgi:hypothetical protein
LEAPPEQQVIRNHGGESVAVLGELGAGAQGAGVAESAPDGESRDRKREVHCGGSRSVQELASGDAVAIGGVTAGGIRSSIAAIRIRCFAVLYSFFFFFFYAHSFPCCDPQITGCHGSSAAVRVEEERELLLSFLKLSKLRVSSPRSS